MNDLIILAGSDYDKTALGGLGGLGFLFGLWWLGSLLFSSKPSENNNKKKKK